MNKIIRILAACIWVLLAMPAALAVPSDIPEVLTQPSIVTPKAMKAAMLAIANAGARLVAVGERGIILLSDDAGKTWRQVPTPVQVSLVAVRFANAHTGWAVGSLGVVLHTSDGGETWSKQLDGIQAASIVAQAAVTPEQQTAAKRLVNDGPDKPFLDLYFKDELNGYIIGAYNLIFRTTDGGKSWQAWQQHVKNPRGWDLYGIRPDGGELFIVGEQGTLLGSHDDGATFEPIASPYKGSYFGLVVGKEGQVVIFGLRGNVFWSGDMGHSWKKIDTGSTVTISAGIRLTDGTLVLVNEAGDLLISHDNGRHFQLQSGKENLPVAGIAEANDGSLIVVGLRGIKHLAPLAAVTKQ
ncbi:MAG TPA: YCF48-related protein [Gallionella sp.]|nr:YCF48-related protein [Gallionella sp.]